MAEDKTSLEDFINHVLIICSIYEASSDKVARIETYAKHVLNTEFKIKGGEKQTNAKRKRSKC